MTEHEQTQATRIRPEDAALAPLGVVLQVADIAEARRFYEAIGFISTGAYPRADGRLTVAFLTSGACMLILGRKDELHYENPERARAVRRGPHGLGVVITLAVPDLAKVYDVVRAEGLEIMMEPADEFYGDRVFMFLDRDGYEWKISQTIASVSDAEIAEVIRAS